MKKLSVASPIIVCTNLLIFFYPTEVYKTDDSVIWATQRDPKAAEISERLKGVKFAAIHARNIMVFGKVICELHKAYDQSIADIEIPILSGKVIKWGMTNKSSNWKYG